MVPVRFEPDKPVIVFTFETVSGWLKSDPPVIENPNGGPPVKSTTKDISGNNLFLLCLCGLNFL